ncbi:RNA-binding S4 domain-containing protein [Kytococcus sedentarius]|uniref:RNA-binding S4 domain-containing protein n=1 Tax=Kytococcus sedentarius TaxID=1276 RepID=UPI0035BC39E1
MSAAQDRITVTITDEFITLGQVLKLANVVDDGAIAREVIQAGDVTLQGETCTQRGRKVRPGEVVGTPVGEILVERG